MPSATFPRRLMVDNRISITAAGFLTRRMPRRAMTLSAISESAARHDGRQRRAAMRHQFAASSFDAGEWRAAHAGRYSTPYFS